MDHDDILIWKLDARVGTHQDRIIPFLDLAQEDIRDRGIGELYWFGQGFAIFALQVDDDRLGPGYRGEHLDPGRGFELLVIQNGIGSSKIDRLFGDLLDAATRSDRLVIEFHRGIDKCIIIEPA